MRWPWQSDEPPPKKPINWAGSLNATDWEHYTSPQTVIPTVILTGGILFTIRVYRLYLKRIPGASYVRPGAFRKRSIFGKVTRVGDGDNFHLYHTPGGRLTGWGWLRKVPSKAVDLKKRTVSNAPPSTAELEEGQRLTRRRLRLESQVSMRLKRRILGMKHSHTRRRRWIGCRTIFLAGE